MEKNFNWRFEAILDNLRLTVLGNYVYCVFGDICRSSFWAQEASLSHHNECCKYLPSQIEHYLDYDHG